MLTRFMPKQNRRSFISTVTGAAVGTALSPWPRAQAAAETGGSTIIDTHTHFYDPTRPEGVPWPPKDDPVLYRRVLPAEYQALPKPQPVTGTVVVEASPWLEDNQWVLDLAAKEPFILGFVGNLPAGTKGFPGYLKRFASNRRFRGIRIGADPIRVGLSHPAYVEDLKVLARHDLALDWLGGPERLSDLPSLANAVPDLRVMIDHVANTRVTGRTPDPEWRKGMQAAARHPNVYCKVSGLVEGTGRTDGSAPRDVEYYRPILDAIWNDFGPDRLVYGSNWPVSARFAPCAVVQQIVAEYFGARGGEALEKVFWRNARKFYGLE